MKNKYEKQLNSEKVLKLQAVNKLAEIMNRKDMTKESRKNKVKISDHRQESRYKQKLLL